MGYDSREPMDLLLLFPPGGAGGLSVFDYSIGVGYVCAYLKSRGHSAEIYTTNRPVSVAECIADLLADGPKAIGFSVYDTNFETCRILARELKASRQDVLIIFGGPTATVNSQFVLDVVPAVDLCVIGYGERSADAVLCRLKSDRDCTPFKFDEIEGVVTRTNAMNTAIPKACAALDLDAFPSPYLYNVIPASAATRVGVVTSRGCNQHCTYCNCAVLSGRRVSLHSIERVVAELTHIGNSGSPVHEVPVFDDAFTLFPRRAKEICRQIAQASVSLPLSCATRCDTVDDELLSAMLGAGFRSIGFSLESATPRVLRHIGKVSPPGRTEQDAYLRERRYIKLLRNAVFKAKEIGFGVVYVSIMVGLPTETPAEANSTVDFVESLPVNSYTHNVFSVYPGTPCWETALSFGYHIEDKRSMGKLVSLTRHHFDPRKEVRVGQKANIRRIYAERDRDVAVTLALINAAAYKGKVDHFTRAIILSDTLSETHVRWLNHNLAIDGQLILLSRQACSDGEKPSPSVIANAPCVTTRIRRFFLRESGGVENLQSAEQLLFGDETLGVPIAICKGFDRTMGTKSCEMKICLSSEETDVLDFILTELERNRDAAGFDHLLKSGAHLYSIAELCAYSDYGANCVSMDTAIVRQNGDVQLCWNGPVIGSIHYGGSQTKDEYRKRRLMVESAQGCSQCENLDTCPRCDVAIARHGAAYCAARGSQPVRAFANAYCKIQALSF